MTNPYQQQQQHGSSSSNNFGDNSLPPLNVRRSSYASIVSGAQQARPATRSAASAFSHILNPSPDSEQQYNSNAYSAGQNHLIDPTIGLGTRNGAEDRNTGHSHNTFWTPSAFSTAFTNLYDKDYQWGTGHSAYTEHGYYESTGPNAAPSLYNISATGFLAPSYLKGSVYLQKLEEQHRARLIAEREREMSGIKPQPIASLASNGNGHHTPSPYGLKVHHASGATHRGVAFEVVEKSAGAPLTEENDGINPLPSRWNKFDKEATLEISNEGYEVSCTGRQASEHEASAVRADHWIDPACGVYYFEILVLNRKRSSPEEYAAHALVIPEVRMDDLLTGNVME